MADIIDKDYKVDEGQDTKARKNNIIMLSLLIVVFIIGIIIRWDYVSSEISTTVEGYFETEKPANDSLNNLKN